jgi:tRNA A58 N-methylase Trm61
MVPSVKASPRFGNDVTQSVTDLWNATYEAKSMDQRSWSQDVATDSLAYVESIRLALNAAVIDIGGGSSPLVNELLARSFTDLTVLDISRSAMEEAREPLENTHFGTIAPFSISSYVAVNNGTTSRKRR